MKSMAITVRLNDKEQEALRKKCVELNKALINKNLINTFVFILILVKFL